MRTTPKHALSLLAGFAAVALSSAAAQANNNAQVPSCFTNRFGIEQCDNPNANGGSYVAPPAPQIYSGSLPDDPQARLKRYCDGRKKSGKIDADGICASSANGD